MTLLLLRTVLPKLWAIFRPEYALADLCTNPRGVHYPGAKPEKKKGNMVMFRPGAWRDKDHEDSFKIANLLEWCVRRAQDRYAPSDYERIVLAGRRLAQSLRLNALLVMSGDEGSMEEYEERKFLALQLATARNPLRFVERISTLTTGEPEPPDLPRRRAARLVELISGGINVHWPALKTIGIAIAIAWLIWSGKLMDAVGLLK